MLPPPPKKPDSRKKHHHEPLKIQWGKKKTKERDIKIKKGVPLVSVSNITKSYKTRKKGEFKVIDNVSLDINEGESIALMGANGAGKTTLVETICGLIKPDKGTIKYNLGSNPKKAIGIQFQDSHYPTGIKVSDIIEFYKGVYTTRFKGFDSAYESFDIKKLHNSFVTSLSGGELQRLNIFLAILNNPKLVFFDELSTGLDIQAKLVIIDFIKKLAIQNSWTIVIVTHNIEDITILCDRVVVMNKGRIVFDGLVKKIKKKYGNLETFISEEVHTTLIMENKEE